MVSVALFVIATVAMAQIERFCIAKDGKTSTIVVMSKTGKVWFVLLTTLAMTCGR